MRKEALKLVRQEFNRLLQERCKVLTQDHTFKGSPGADLYVWRVADNLRFFIHLLPNPKSYRDSFMIELGWSGGDYPVQAPMQNKYRLDTKADGRIRLPSLWREQWPSALEPWWEVGDSLGLNNADEFYSNEETVRRTASAPKAVMEAVEKIEKYALPFFENIASERGVPSLKKT